MIKKICSIFFIITSLLLLPSPSFASSVEPLDLTDSFIGYFALLIFFVAYVLVMAEDASS